MLENQDTHQARALVLVGAGLAGDRLVVDGVVVAVDRGDQTHQ